MKKRDEERRQQKRNIQVYSILRCGDISHLISDFSGIISELPLAIIGRRIPRKILLGGKLYSISSILSLPWGSYFEDQCILGAASFLLNEIRNQKSLALSVWYATQRIRIGVDKKESYNVPCTSSPWSEVVSLKDAEWYFRSRQGGSHLFLSMADLQRCYDERICSGLDTKHICRDELWLLHYYRLIPLKEVPILHSNILNFAMRGMWETVGKLVERGDLYGISPYHLCMLSAKDIDHVLSFARSMWKKPFEEWEGKMSMENATDGDVEKIATILRHYVIPCSQYIHRSVMEKHYKLLPKEHVRQIFNRYVEDVEFGNERKRLIERASLTAEEIVTIFREPIVYHTRFKDSAFSSPSFSGADEIIDHISHGNDSEAVALISNILITNHNDRMVTEFRVSRSMEMERHRMVDEELLRMEKNAREYENRILDLSQRLKRLEMHSSSGISPSERKENRKESLRFFSWEKRRD